MQDLKRLILVLLGAVLMAVCINTFVHAGGLIPGGFTGLTLLIQEICLRDLGVSVPFSLIFYIFNAVPVIICFRYVGKKFTLYSCLTVLICGVCTDCMPKMFIDFIQLHDTLLASVFGGLLNAFAISLCLYAGAASGGTELIAIYLSEKYRRDSWYYIFWGNCVVLIIAGTLFSLNRAFYSIIFQFVTTVALGALYKAYQQKTLFIVTDKPYEVYAMINEMTHHGATLFRGEGLNPGNRTERILLYSVVSSTNVKALTNAIHKIDPDAFINVIRTDQLNGSFYMAPKD